MKINKLITHNGTFHADDLFACATLSIYLEKKGEDLDIIRTRNKEIILSGDYVFDVGGIYNPEQNRFDHHQVGGAGKRENGIEYASFGLVWKHFGMELCENNLKTWKKIDSKLVAPIDAVDNGIDAFEPKFKDIMQYNSEQNFLIFSPTWQEDESKIDDIFRSVVLDVVKVLKREIEVAKSDTLGVELLEGSYSSAINKKIIVSSTSFPRYLYQETLSGFLEPIYFVYPSNHSDTWKVEAISKSPNTLESRKLFPEEWRNCFDNSSKLSEVTGVKDALFCHRSGFLMTVKSKEGALALAELALKN
ncbi:MAG: MYG1 family protein [Candidatus Nomurabacteria bacterium]|nr:MYG1 family protein [Candidatus Nomurabacteria bacterium]